MQAEWMKPFKKTDFLHKNKLIYEIQNSSIKKKKIYYFNIGMYQGSFVF